MLLKTIELFGANHGILEEAAGAANLLHIGEFVIADGADGIVQLLKSGLLHSVFGQICFDVAVFKMERCTLFQKKVHGGDDVLPLAFAFEDALTVAETAFVFRKNVFVARS